MIALVVAVLVAIGTTFMLLGALGMVRMPDVYTRLQVATKAASLGAGCLLLSIPLLLPDPDVGVRALLIIAFIFLTAPISAHMLGRAAYIMGVELWHESVRDELAGRYDRTTHELDSPRIDDGYGGA